MEKDKDQQITFIYPDTMISTDTHTTLSNGFGVLSYSKEIEWIQDFIREENIAF